MKGTVAAITKKPKGPMVSAYNELWTLNPPAWRDESKEAELTAASEAAAAATAAAESAAAAAASSPGTDSSASPAEKLWTKVCRF